MGWVGVGFGVGFGGVVVCRVGGMRGAKSSRDFVFYECSLKCRVGNK